MCSILGIVSPQRLTKLDAQSKEIIPALIRANKHRGGDGAGIWSEKWGLIKGVKLNVIKEFMRRSDDSTFLIHLRSASSGDVNNKHCHPFNHNNDVVFCHNGHIANYLQYKVSMDSLAGLRAIVKGIEEINKLSGWFVFAWLDKRNKRNGTFNLLNHNGSIQYGWLGGRLVFASMGLDRYLKQVFEVPQDVWYTFNLSGQSVIRLDEVKVINPEKWSNRYYFPYDSEYYPRTLRPTDSEIVEDDEMTMAELSGRGQRKLIRGSHFIVQ